MPDYYPLNSDNPEIQRDFADGVVRTFVGNQVSVQVTDEETGKRFGLIIRHPDISPKVLSSYLGVASLDKTEVVLGTEDQLSRYVEGHETAHLFQRRHRMYPVMLVETQAEVVAYIGLLNDGHPQVLVQNLFHSRAVSVLQNAAWNRLGRANPVAMEEMAKPSTGIPRITELSEAEKNLGQTLREEGVTGNSMDPRDYLGPAHGFFLSGRVHGDARRMVERALFGGCRIYRRAMQDAAPDFDCSATKTSWGAAVDPHFVPQGQQGPR